MLITSPANEKIKFARSLARKKERVASGRILLEGTRLIQEAVNARLTPAMVFYERAAFDRDAHTRALVIAMQKQTREVFEVTPQVMHALADTETPQGISAVFPPPPLTPPSTLALVLVLDRIRDPGNLGTILRTAWAANVSAVLLAPETADAFNPKVVRAGMGAHFHLPLLTVSWDEIVSRMQGISRIYLSDAAATLDYTRADWTPPVALIVSNEAEGASADARRLATQTLSIPMPGSAESLNAAVAAGILLFQAIRTG